MAADVKRLFLVICVYAITGTESNESPVFEHDMNNVVVIENTPVGRVIGKLEGYDPEGSTVHYGLEGTDYLTVDKNSGEMKIAKPFDREINDTLQFTVTLEDEVSSESGNMNNVVKVPISIIIDDENDNAPYFKSAPYEFSIREDVSVGSIIFDGISAEDVDLIGDTLEVTCENLPEFTEACDKFAVTTWNNSERYYEGGITLKNKLDFDDKQLYRLTLIVSDGKYNTSTKVEIKVLDIQNKPPIFYGSTSAVVQEDTPVGFSVLTVRAKDGDHGNPRNIIFDLLKNPHDYFLLNGNTGELHVAKPLDRESLIDTNGMISLTVRAREVFNDTILNDEMSSTTAVLSLTIKDANDEGPIFNKPEYRVSVPENIPTKSPLPNLDMTVTDADVGNNSAFSLRLGDDLDKFTVEPSSAIGSASVIIRLANGSLDYENPDQRKFIVLVIAEELASPSRFSSSALVTIDVTDVNDNTPQFDSSAFTASVNESALPGSVVVMITGTDRDSGSYGTEGIVYDLAGNGSERFNVNRNTGVITVALCSTPGVSPCLDYETKTVYFLTYKATDDEGKGRATTVPLKIEIIDANDNPPEFTAKNYTALVDEGATHFELPFFVQARDLDTVSSITYFIPDENITGLLDMDSSSGEIKIVNARGLERINGSDTVAFDVMATDGLYNETARVIIRITDVNDHQPVFGQSVYDFTLAEDTTIGTSIVRLNASDADVGINSVITYKIEKGSYDDFSVNSTSGVVYVAASLDYDRRKYYNMTVVAIDAGTPALTGTATLNVFVTNVNDKEPYFTPTVQRTEVPKDAIVGTVLYKMKAIDPDMNGTDALNFMLVDPVLAINVNGKEVKDHSDIYKGFFAINITSGEVYVANPLKRDIASVIHLSVIVTDTSAPNPQHGKGTLIITILEVNDIPPVFASPWEKERPYYITQILEEQPIGTVLGTFVATDYDSSIDHYEIEPASEYFSVDRTTGTIRTKNRIDFEQVQSINFTLIAYDSGEPQLSAVAYVVVTVININDMTPVFQQNVYYVSVKENSPKGTLITKVTAVDKDLGDYGIVRYSLTGDRQNDFTINENTGEIKVANPNILDREKMTEIIVMVVASDFASQSEIRNSTALVRIKLEDKNDNAPIFTQHPYAATIVETIPYSPPSPILQLHAEDKDEHTYLQYRITGGNEADLFFLDPKSGILYPKNSLLGLERQYTLTVEVSDGVFTDTTKIELTVLDVNQNKPQFKQPSSSNATVIVSEDVDVNHLVIKVLAEDKDAGDNGRVTYHFKIDNNNVQNTAEFSINETTGEIRTRISLDREKQAQYQFILVARDHGTQTTYESLRYLTISVKDVNDNKPTFITDSHDNQYVFNIKENGDVNKKVAKLMAIDKDEGEYAKLYFHVLKGNEDSAFIIDRQTGYVYVNGTLDREMKNYYEFYVKVTNEQNYNSAGNEIISEDDPSVVRIIVHVEDENDNAPFFKQSSYYAGVNTVAGIGEFLTTVNAIDYDQEENGSLQYEIGASYLYKAGANHTSGSIVPSPFTINPQGKITTAAFVAEYNQDRFELLIIAREISPPHREAITSVHVWVYELQQLVRVILSRPPREVTSVVSEIVTELSNATGSVIVVDDIKYHVDDVGQIQQDWCDMYMHLVDNDTHSIITIPDVLKVIDDKYDYLKDYYAGFAIENVLPAYIDSMEEQFEPALAALVALLIILCVGGVSVIVICFCFRHWVITSPSDMKCDMLIKKPIIDDLSTTENPLWIEQKLKLYEEQELTMQVFCEPEASRLPCGAGIERRGSDGTSVIDNTYATIQHPVRRNSANNMLSLGPGDYATLGGSVLPLDKASSHSQQMLEAALGFQGCTFQVPDTPPDTVELLRARSELRVNKDGQPEFVSELM